MNRCINNSIIKAARYVVKKVSAKVREKLDRITTYRVKVIKKYGLFCHHLMMLRTDYFLGTFE